MCEQDISLSSNHLLERTERKWVIWELSTWANFLCFSPPKYISCNANASGLGVSWWTWSPSPWLGLMPKVGVLGEKGNAGEWDYRKTTMQTLWCKAPKGLCMCSLFQLWGRWGLLQQVSVLRLQQGWRDYWRGMVNLHPRPPQCLFRQKEENIDVFLLDISYNVKNMFF